MGMRGSNWEGAKLTDIIGENLKSARFGLAIGSLLIGGTSTALAQENINPGQNSASITQRILNAQPVPIQGVNDLLNKWTSNQNLYVQGPKNFAGFNDKEQLELAKWLATNHPNWTVVFVGNSSGQNYQGNRLEKAYEFGIGQSLMGSADFSLQKDSETKMKTGATLLIVAAPNRWMAWGSSQLQEHHGLDYKTRWVNGFDSILKTELRRQRWSDGVKKVIGAIDEELFSAIQAEKDAEIARKEQAQRAAQAAKEDAYNNIAQTKSSLSTLEEELKLFRADYPEVKSTLAYPNINGISEQITQATNAYQNGDLARANQISSELSNDLQMFSKNINQYRTDGESMSSFLAQFDQLKSQQFYNHGKQNLEESKKEYKSALVLWKVGDLNYQTNWSNTQKSLSNGISLIDQAKNAFNRTSDLEKQIAAAKKNSFHNSGEKMLANATESIEKAKLMLKDGNADYTVFMNQAESSLKKANDAMSSAAAIDTTKKTSATVILLGIIGLLSWKNVSRKQSKQQAQEKYKFLDNAIAEKASQLFEFDQATVTQLSGGNFKGATKAAKEHILGQIPPLYVMITCAQEVLDKAEKLLNPTSTSAKIKNLFSPNNYQKVLALLEDEAVSWDEDSQLPELIRGKKLGSQVMWQDLVDFQPFKMSFEEILEKFNDNAKSVDANLSAFNNAQTESAQKMQELQAAAEKLSNFKLVGELQLASVKSATLPTLANQLQRANEILYTDPITANQLLIQAETDIQSPINVLQEASLIFQQAIPSIQSSKDWCAKNGVETTWVDNELNLIVENVDKYLARSASTEDEIQKPDTQLSLTQLTERANKAKLLAEILSQKYVVTLKQTQSEVDDARKTISSTLSLDPQNVLSEKNQNPDQMISEAKRLKEEAHRCINSGNLDEAEQVIIKASDLFAQTRQLVAESLESLNNHQKSQQAAKSRLDELENQSSDFEAILSSIKANYAPSVLVLGAGDPTHPRENDKLEDNIVEAQKSFEKAAQCLAQSIQAHKNGQLLHSQALINQVNGLLDFANFRFDEIAEKQQRLQEVQNKNSSSANLINKLASDIQHEIQTDTIISNETLNQFEIIHTQIQHSLKNVGVKGTDPFEIESTLLKLNRDIQDIQSRMEDDRENYHSAKDSVSNATRELARINSELEDIRHTGAGLSNKIAQAVSDLKPWQEELDNIKRILNAERQDWADVARQADRIVRKGSQIFATVQNESDEIDRVLEKLKSAERRIKEARSWSGSYGVRVSGSPGQNQLNQALQLISNGAYAQALDMASRAYSESNSAIEDAESLVRRRRREEQEAEERRQAEERARRRAEEDERNRRSSYSSTSSSSSWGSSSDSGMGGSSFGGGSDSGMGGSSW